jgi:hypothetical protein
MLPAYPILVHLLLAHLEVEAEHRRGQNAPFWQQVAMEHLMCPPKLMIVLGFG